MAPFDDFYRGRSVLVTGHTGFKGSWLTCWLQALGARVAGYALEPSTEPSLFHLLTTPPAFGDHRGDIRDAVRLQHVIDRVRPETIFHLAAQPIVRRSYEAPLETLEVNAMGTATLLEAVRRARRPCVVVIVTSDKCYENAEWVWGYREDDKLGGHDPYSVSKAAAELIVASWRRSFFSPERVHEHGIRVASVRAGNVIGGGDWSPDRLVPDCVRALRARDVIRVRNPRARRPWQHVLEPLSGYLWLGARMAVEDDAKLLDAWNFGPSARDSRSVADLVDTIVDEWGSGSWQDVSQGGEVYEAQQLSLVCDKALQHLSWWPTWTFERALSTTVQWYRAWANDERDLWQLCQRQIVDYTADAQTQSVSWAGGHEESRPSRMSSAGRRQAMATLAGDSLLLLSSVL
jgi:CDP-glucose 4,6-dehydratase